MLYACLCELRAWDCDAGGGQGEVLCLASVLNDGDEIFPIELQSKGQRHPLEALPCPPKLPLITVCGFTVPMSHAEYQFSSHSHTAQLSCLDMALPLLFSAFVYEIVRPESFDSLIFLGQTKVQ